MAVTNIGPCIGCTTWHVTTDWHSLGTLRGRAGIAAGPVLFYGTAGLAWAIVKTDNKVDCTSEAGRDSLERSRCTLAR